VEVVESLRTVRVSATVLLPVDVEWCSQHTSFNERTDVEADAVV
jgi:hypothetical protein